MRSDFRLHPISDKDWPDQISDMQSGFAGGLNVYRMMAHHPDLLKAWAGLREHIVNRSSLGPQLLEVVILRAGSRLGSDYEWAQHVVRARRQGLQDARIATLRGPVDGMAPEDTTLAQAVDELFDKSALTSATKTALAELVDTEGVLDLMATVGFYSTLGYILNSFQTPLDENIAEELATTPLPK